jgi:hypothetical protein
LNSPSSSQPESYAESPAGSALDKFAYLVLYKVPTILDEISRFRKGGLWERESPFISATFVLKNDATWKQDLAI